LSLSTRDVLAALSGVIATFVLAVAFLAVLRRTHRISALETRRPSASSADIAPMVLGLLVLASVVLQEETLNRGYVSYNLLPLGRVGILVISTVTFVLIHFLTNRANLAQVISWTISGLTLALAYLLSGSIWVPIILHYATDAANVLIFNITGRYSFFITTPALTEGQRAVFRVTYGLAITAILFAFYGLNFKIG
jgi:membrane protease YdiL (CAAX protease family)